MALAANDWWWLRENLVAYRYACGLPDPSIDQWRSNYLAERHDATHLAWFGLYSLPRSSIRLRRLNVGLFTSRRVFFSDSVRQHWQLRSYGHWQINGRWRTGRPHIKFKMWGNADYQISKIARFLGASFQTLFSRMLGPKLPQEASQSESHWGVVPDPQFTLYPF